MQYVTENCLLNDDCMLEVFKYFDINDLLTTCRVSLQFQRLANSIFSQKYGEFIIDNRNHTADDKILIQIFKNFGHLMRSIKTPERTYLWYDRNTQKLIIILIKKYCSSTLKSLKLKNFASIKRYLILMDNIFLNLEILHLEYVAIPFSILQLIRKLPLINDLKINYCVPILPITATYTPIVNLNLQKLSLKCRDRFYMTNVLNVIHLLFPNLTELKFQIIGTTQESLFTFNKALRNIGMLQYLSLLDIDIECEPIEKLILNLNSNKRQIKHLCIHYCLISSYGIDCLTDFNALEELFIINTINN